MCKRIELFYYLVAIAAAAFFSACTDDDAIEPQVFVNEGRGLVTVLTASESNPNLISEWEHVSEIVLNQVGGGGSDIIVSTPWVDGVSTKLSSDFCKDIKKANGWVMLFHTFKRKGLDPKQNYICFYNLFTGVLKVFYYFEGGPSATNTTWFIKADSATPFKTLDEPSYFSLPDNEASVNTANKLLFMNESITEPNALEVGWNGFEYQVPRYSTDFSSCRFTIGAYSHTINSVTLNGDAKLNTSGVVNSVTTNYATTDRYGVDGIATYSGKKAEDYIKSRLPGKVSFWLWNDILNAAPGFGNSIVKSAISKGLGFLFGRTTTATNYYTTSDVRLNTIGNLSYKGTLTETNTAGIPTVTFDLWSILNPYSLPVATSPWELSSLVTPVVPLRNYLSNLGTWTVTEKPVTYWDFCQPLSISEFINSDCEFIGTVPTPKITRYDLNVKFNRYIEQYITSHEVKVDFLFHKGPTTGTFWSNVFPYDEANAKHEEQAMSFLRSHHDSQISRSTLYSDSILSYYGIPEHVNRNCRVLADFTRDLFNENTQWYLHWDLPPRINTVALVTVTMDITYCGHTFQVKETRQYLCNNARDSNTLNPSSLHNPPYTIVLTSRNSMFADW